jgi:hypothetical protein
MRLVTCVYRILPILWIVSAGALAAEEGHHPPNHIALLIGHAEEEKSDGHHESGSMVGVEYFREIHPKWRLGVAFEQETFGDNHDRAGVLALPVSYFLTRQLRLFAAPGIEFRDKGEPDKFMFRVGLGYQFDLTKRISIAPEAQVDFIAGGTQVYVFALALGFGF